MSITEKLAAIAAGKRSVNRILNRAQTGDMTWHCGHCFLLSPNRLQFNIAVRSRTLSAWTKDKVDLLVRVAEVSFAPQTGEIDAREFIARLREAFADVPVDLLAEHQKSAPEEIEKMLEGREPFAFNDGELYELRRGAGMREQDIQTLQHLLAMTLPSQFAAMQRETTSTDDGAASAFAWLATSPDA